MVTKDKTINGVNFRLTKMTALEQLPVAAELMPLYQQVISVAFKSQDVMNSFENKDNEPDEERNKRLALHLLNSDLMDTVSTMFETLEPSKLQRIAVKFLRKTQIVGGTVTPVLDDRGEIIVPELIELDTLLILCKEHFVLNFSSLLKSLQ